MKSFFKSKTSIFFIFNVLLLIILFFLSFPLYNFLSNKDFFDKTVKLADNENVRNSVIKNSNFESPKVISRIMKVNFNTEIDSSLNWYFESIEDMIEIKVGENIIAKFEGKNLSNKSSTGTAEFFASPEIILPYLIKTECFCFTEQTLKPGESQIFTMVFFLDSSLDNDVKLDNVTDLTFTYKFSEYSG